MAKKSKIVFPTLDDNGKPRPPIGDDLIWGAEAIADELSISATKVFRYLNLGYLPATKVGQQWVASRTKLRAHLLGEDEGDSAA
jgi:hypothetical protein